MASDVCNCYTDKTNDRSGGLVVFSSVVIIFGIISYVYATVRGLKDVYVINNMGASSIYCAKVAVLFFVVLFTYLYTKIAKCVNRVSRFNIVVGFFLAFFVFFRFFVMSHSEALRMDSLADYLCGGFPRFCAWWELVRYWHLAVLYIISEAWGVFVMNVLFWSFTNAIISPKRAKVWYFYFFTGAAIGSLGAGVFMKLLSDDRGVQYSIVILLIVFLLVFYNGFEKYLCNHPELCSDVVVTNKKKVKLSFGESIKFLLGSRYLRLVSYVVFGYYSFISFTESIWKGLIGQYKDELKAKFLAAHPGMLDGAKKVAEDFTNDLYGTQSVAVGMFQLFLILFAAKKSWKFVAMFTPTVALVLVSIFLAFLKSQSLFEFLTVFRGVSNTYVAIMIGLVIVVVIKSAKYIFFDSSKERSYIPLDEESKINGKAAIDATGSRIGKAAASIVISFVLVPMFGDLISAQWATFVFVFFALFLWLYAVNALSPEYEKKLEEYNASKSDA